MTYSLDLRKKVLAVRAADHLSLEETASRFHIGKATLMRWLRQLEPKATRERTRPKISDDALLKDVADYPDSYQFERAERLGVSASGIAKALKRCGITHKKRRYATPRLIQTDGKPSKTP